MFRLRGTPLLLSAAGLSLAMNGCHQMIYREMYSPRKNYFVPPVEKAPVMPTEALPPAPVTPAVPSALPDAGGLPGLPPPAAAAPAVPGMDMMTPPPPAN